MKKPIVIIIAGPTAVGKTAFAISLAKRLGTSILSADSRQCFRELDIGVAKPSPEELEEVPHYFINSHSVFEELTAAHYEQYALQALETIFAGQEAAVVVGGTGMYLRALAEGLDEMPAIEDALRQSIREEYAEKGLQWLQETVRREDPLYYESGEIENPQRLMRALEVRRSAGRSIRHFQQGNPKERPFQLLWLGLDLPRDLLHDRIERRVDAMLLAGLEEEARGWNDHRDLNALQTVGYREWFDYFDGKISKTKAVEQIRAHTRQYAKRQLTWFRKNPQIHWLSPQQPDKALEQSLLLLDERR